MTDKERILKAILCHDWVGLSRVPNAGRVENLNGERVQVMHNGLVTLTDSHYGDWNVEVISRLEGCHEPQEEIVFDEFVKAQRPGAVMIEVGSFWAFYSMWFKKAVPDSVVYLFEPLLGQMEYGIRNFKINNLEGNFYNLGIGSADAKFAEIEPWLGQKITIEVKTIDSIVKDLQLDSVDLLHADIQGHEIEMLKGASLSLKNKKIKNLFVSTHSDYLHYHCLKRLKREGYFIPKNFYPSQSFTVDGFIFASTDTKKSGAKMSKNIRLLTEYQRVKMVIKETIKGWVQ